MHFLYQYVYEYPLIAVVQAIFTLWMLVDAVRRGGEQKWLWIILFLPVLGAVAYFIMEMMPRLRGHDVAAWFQRPASLEELRYRTEQSPTLANHLAFAQRLIDHQAYADALPQLEAAGQREPDHGQVLYSLALCRVRLGQPDDALPLLARLIQRDPRWSDFSAWRLLRETHVDRNDAEQALTTCRELVKLSPSLQNQCTLAEQLLDMGQAAEARPILEKVITDHAYQPAPIRRRNRKWAKEAKRMLRRTAG